jgi:hypothetical protein
MNDLADIDPASLKQFSWAYRDLIGQKREWTPTQSPRTVVASSSTNPLDDLIRVNASSAPITMQLETAVGADGRRHTFKKVDSTANAMTLTCFSTQTLDGVTSAALAVQYGAFSVISNGTNWELTRPQAGVYTNVYDSALCEHADRLCGRWRAATGEQRAHVRWIDARVHEHECAIRDEHGAGDGRRRNAAGAGAWHDGGVRSPMASDAGHADASAVNLFLGKSRGAAIGTQGCRTMTR